MPLFGWRGTNLGGSTLSHSTRVAGVLCALGLLTATTFPAYADESPRLRPSTRGGRQEAPASPRTTSPVAPAPAPAAQPPPAVPEPPPAPPAPSLGDRVADLAVRFVGSPYTWGGASPVTGFDCSGLVQWVLGQVGVDPGRVVWSQYQRGTPVPADDLQPGDLVFFANTYTAGLSHVGIYVGGGQFVDAGTERTGVRRASLWDPYWGPRFVGARRFPS